MLSCLRSDYIYITTGLCAKHAICHSAVMSKIWKGFSITKAKKEDIYKIHVTFCSLVLTISVTIFSVYLNFQNKMKTLLKLTHAIAIANSFNWSGLIVPVLSSLHKLLETAVVTSFLNQSTWLFITKEKYKTKHNY